MLYIYYGMNDAELEEMADGNNKNGLIAYNAISPFFLYLCFENLLFLMPVL